MKRSDFDALEQAYQSNPNKKTQLEHRLDEAKFKEEVAQHEIDVQAADAAVEKAMAEVEDVWVPPKDEGRLMCVGTLVDIEGPDWYMHRDQVYSVPYQHFLYLRTVFKDNTFNMTKALLPLTVEHTIHSTESYKEAILKQTKTVREKITEILTEQMTQQMVMSPG